MVERLKPQGFKEAQSADAVVAQLVEHVHGKDGVAGSIPANGSG